MGSWAMHLQPSNCLDPWPIPMWPLALPKKFHHAMISCLDDGEKAEADNRYLGEPTKTLIPKVNTITPADAEL